MKSNLMIIVFMSLLIGCAKAPKTTAKFNLKSLSNLGASVNLISENGIVIFGTNDKGHRFAKVMNTTDDFNYELDNGLWTFKAVAWDEGDPAVPGPDTPGDKFTGTPSCALATVALNGSESVINLALRNVDCATADFSVGGKSHIPGSNIEFHPLTDIYSCDESVGDGSTVTLGSKCLNDFAQYAANGGDNAFLNRGYHSSYKIVAKSFYSGPTALSVGSGVISSVCLTANNTSSGAANGLGTLSDLQIPSGAGLNFTVEAFYTENCSGRKNDYVLNNGLNSIGGKVGITNTATPSQTLYLRSFPTDVCQGAGLTDDYAGGNGSEGKPYLICTANQLNKMYDLTAVPYTKNYRLVRSVDMNNSTFHATNGNIIAAGKNFKPLGYRENDASMPGGTCGNAATNAMQFSGNFDGGGNAIKNLKMEAFKAFDGQYCDNTGFFAYSNNAKFARMKFENVEIDEGSSFTGILVGNAFNTNIYGVHVQGATINVDNSVLAISPIIGDLLGTSSYEEINFNNIQINSLITPITNIAQNATGLCEGTGIVSLNGSGIDTGPDTANCTSGSFNIATTLTAADGQKDFTITHLNGSTVNASYLFDNPVPTVTQVYSAKPDGTYTTSEVIDVLIEFSEIVIVTGTPQLALNAGGASSAAYFSGSGSNILTFRYTVAATENSADLDYLSTTSLTLSGGTIIGGSAANLTLPTPGGVNSISDDKAIVINTGGGTPNITNITSTTPDGTYPSGQLIDIVVTFDSNVITSTSSLSLDNGATANYSTGSGTSSIIYQFTTAAAQDTADLNVISFNIGDSGASATIPASQNLADNKAIVIDATPPTVVNITSSKTDGAYKAGEIIQIAVQFSEAVIGAGGMTLSLDSGGTASFATGGGSTNLIFNYTVLAAQNSADLNVSTINIGSATDGAGNIIIGTIPGGQNLADNKAIVVDTVVPTVSITTFPHINGINQASYTVSGACSENGENVSVDIGGVVTTPTCTANVWSTFIDASGIIDSASVSITADIMDVAGNTATQAIQTVIKDTIIPTIVSVSDFTNASPYTDGQSINLRITFSEPVEISGSATLDLNVSNLAVSNQATSTTTTSNIFHDFNFVVGQYQVTLELDYISSTSLTIAGVIRDQVGNDLNNILPNPGPGNTGSLSNSSPNTKVLGGLPFDSTWETTNAGASATNQIKLPLDISGTYDFIVDWGDGSMDHITAWNDAQATHTFGGPGAQSISIYGKVSTFKFDGADDKDKLLTVPGIGNVGWESFLNSFKGCSNLTIFDGGGGDTSMVTNMSGMFAAAPNALPSTSGWVTSNVTDMSYMFDGASAANPDVSGWDTTSVTNMSYMFRAALAANPNVSSWITTNVTDMQRMFDNAQAANPDVSTWNTANVVNMNSMFSNTIAANPDVLSWNVGSVINMSSMFRNSSATPLVGSWDTSSVTNMSFMFKDNSAANPQVDSWNTSNVTDMRNLFENTPSALPNMSGWDFSSVTNIGAIIDGCGLNNLMYTNFLIAVEATALPANLNGVTVNTPAQYQAAGTTAHSNLLAGPFNWILNDAGLQP